MTIQEQTTQRRLEAALARYVAMPTVPTDIPACSAAIKGLSVELEKLGMVTHIDGPVHPWLIATTTQKAMQTKQVKVLFVIHFDVVPFENEGQMTLRSTKDRLFGRGVYDMKFAAACVREMIADFAKQGTLKEYDLGVLITTDEEQGGYDGAYDFLQRGWRSDIAIVPDGGWNWSIEGRAKGLTYLYLTAHGRGAHSSRPWTGKNPLHDLTPAVSDISVHFKNKDELGTIVSVNSIETSNGAIYNTTQIPSWAKAGISIRAFTKEETTDAIGVIQSIAQKYNLTIEETINDAPVHLMQDNPLVKEFITIAQEIHGAPIGLSDAMASSDARHFAKYDLATVLMYPNGGDHHGPQEWIVRSDLYKYYVVCKTFVERNAHTGDADTRSTRMQQRFNKYKQRLNTLARR